MVEGERTRRRRRKGKETERTTGSECHDLGPVDARIHAGHCGMLVAWMWECGVAGGGLTDGDVGRRGLLDEVELLESRKGLPGFGYLPVAVLAV